jgi:hypothetical protein
VCACACACVCVCVRVCVRVCVCVCVYIYIYLFINYLQRIRATINDEEQRRMVTELHASVMSDKCEYLVSCYGAMFREGVCVLDYKHHFIIYRRRMDMYGNDVDITGQVLSYVC